MTVKPLTNLLNLYQDCRLCPRDCRVDRTCGAGALGRGFCGETNQLRVAYVGPHFGEEPPITGRGGSGTVFFSGCGLKCTFCQNHQISREGMGRPLASKALYERVVKMIREKRVHNINFVTPDHFMPHVLKLVSKLRRAELAPPVVYNFSGYQSLNTLKYLEPFADIYLPDFKYADSRLATKLSACGNYSDTALGAIWEMIRQKGFLNSFETETPIATKGVLVRHLILPGHIDNSISALTGLLVEFGPRLPLSLMSQYHPVAPQQDEHLNRTLTREEFERVYQHVRALGFEHVFVQFPRAVSGDGGTSKPFLPDFKKIEPFQKHG